VIPAQFFPRLSAFLASTCSVLAVTLLFAECVSRRNKWRLGAAGFLLVGTLAQGLSFLVYASKYCREASGGLGNSIPYSCSFRSGSGAAILAATFMLVAGIVACRISDGDEVLRSGKRNDLRANTKPTSPTADANGALRIHGVGTALSTLSSSPNSHDPSAQQQEYCNGASYLQRPPQSQTVDHNESSYHAEDYVNPEIEDGELFFDTKTH
jgi:hypothetical protein